MRSEKNLTAKCRQVGSEGACRLEAELRSEGDSQIVLRASIEEDVVACFHTQADRPKKSFETDGGIYREIGGSIAQANTIDEARGGPVVGDIEIVEADFSGYECVERGRSDIELGPEESMQDTQFGIHGGRTDSVTRSTGVVPLKVVAHFRFELQVGADSKRCATAQTNEVAGRSGIGEAIVVREYTEVDVIHGLLLSEEHGTCKKQQRHEKT